MNNRISEIKARLEKATPGPWVEYDAKVYVERGSVKIALPMGRKDAEFIAHAPEDIRFLLNVIEKLQMEIVKERLGDIRKLREENQRLREELEKVHQQSMAYFEIANNALRG